MSSAIATTALLPAYWMPTGASTAKRIDLAPALGLDWPGPASRPASDPWSALREAHRQAPGRDLLLLRADHPLPAGFWARIAATWTQASDIDVLSCLDRADVTASDDDRGHDIDGVCWQRGEHALFDCAHTGTHGSLWRAAALAELFAEASPAHVLPSLRKAVLPCVWLDHGDDDRHGACPDWLLAPINQHLEKAKPPITANATSDARPVLLHVLHAWGGGIECFARDLQAGDSERRHFFLLSQHDNYEPPFGRRMALFSDLDAPALRTWELADAIDDTAVASPEVARLLATIIAEWGVGAVLVSSLIGHSLDVLRTGLPTAVCVHDIYPLWPLLHDPRDPRDGHFDLATLAMRLADNGANLLFRQRDPLHWQRLRAAYVALLHDKRIAMVTPSAFSRERICAIEPALAELNWQQIAHGAPAMPRLEKTAPRSHSAPLRVLVPGHIPGGKGQHLLSELLPMLDEGFEVFLLGAGPAGHRFMPLPFVRFQEHYRREFLADSVARFQPDIALLPSTVPETWGYVLTEMLQLGIPVLAGKQGAYAERLRDGQGGWLVEASAAAMATALKTLRDKRQLLSECRVVAQDVFSGPAEMAIAWRQALQARPFQPHYQAASADRIQKLAEHARRDQETLLLTDANSRLKEQNRLLELDNLDESEQRHLLECDLAIKLGKLELAEAEQQTLQTENKALQREAIAQLQALAAAEDELGRSRRDLAAVQEAANRLQLENRLAFEKMEAAFSARNSELSAALASIEALTAHREIMQGQIDGLEASAAHARAHIAHLENSRLDLQQAALTASTQIESLQSSASNARAHIAHLENSRLDLQQAVLDANTHIDNLESSASNARTHIAHLEKNSLGLQQAALDANAQLDALYRSRSWRITAGLRWLRQITLAPLASLVYRARRVEQWLRRASASLRHRGLRSSWQRFRQQQASAPTDLPLATYTTAATDENPIAFVATTAPKASIIIPVYNQIAITLDCLASITERGAACSFEVIVVDDASASESIEPVAAIPGVRLHRNEKNLGFIGACNAGAALARGEFLVFLNNDTLVQADWLDALLATFESHPDTGLAGSKLVYPDGRLQEAGGIVFSDGSGWNYGRFDDPARPAYNFVREVDYCSGAAIAVPTALFRQLDGFDSHYAPAYYEDTDLAMRVRQRGLKVRYQPASVVVHLEGATSGTDLQQGVKAYQVANHKKFLTRWQAVLEREHPAPGTDIAIASSHRARKRLLVIDACTPMPDRDSGSVRMFELLRLAVDDGHAVSFFPDNRLNDGAYTLALQQIGVQVWWHPWLADVPAWLKEHGHRFDAIIVSRHYILTPLLPLLRQHAPQARIVFDTVDLHFLREQREAEQRDDAASRRSAQRTREAELALIGAVNETWVVSSIERELLAELAPAAKVAVLSNIHRPRGLGPGHDQRTDLVFVGGYRHTPNVDAVLWLAAEIFPLIRARRPEIQLHLVGSDTPDSVRDLAAQPGIVVHGHVPDLTPLLDRTRINLAPLRYGAGVKGKINHSLAHGLPVVATTCAAEGMQLVHRMDAMVADSAQAFADAVLELYDDAGLWQQLADAGLENTRQHFSPERARPVLRALLGE